MINILKDLAMFVMVGFTLLLLATTVSFFFIKIPSVPSSRRLLNLLFEQMQFEKGAHFVDLGAGGGRVLFQAEKHGLQAHGYEISILPYLWSRLSKALRRSKVNLNFANFFKQDLSKAQYVYCYLFSETVAEAWDKIKKENPAGTYFITNTFRLKSEKPIRTLLDHKQKPKIFIYQT